MVMDGFEEEQEETSKALPEFTGFETFRGIPTGEIPDEEDVKIPPSPEVLAQTQIRKDAAMDRMIGNVIPIPEHFRPGSKQERAFIAGWLACREKFADRFGRMIGL